MSSATVGSLDRRAWRSSSVGLVGLDFGGLFIEVDFKIKIDSYFRCLTVFYFSGIFLYCRSIPLNMPPVPSFFIYRGRDLLVRSTYVSMHTAIPPPTIPHTIMSVLSGFFSSLGWGGGSLCVIVFTVCASRDGVVRAISSTTWEFWVVCSTESALPFVMVSDAMLAGRVARGRLGGGNRQRQPALPTQAPWPRSWAGRRPLLEEGTRFIIIVLYVPSVARLW
jgi:hypothetical protein